MFKKALPLTLVSVVLFSNWGATEKIQIVTTMQGYASIAQEIGGQLVDAKAIIAGNMDAHFIKPKPSYALKLRQADLFITTGLDLELWVPTLLRKAANDQIAEGSAGFVSAATGVNLLEIPAQINRQAGDIHIFGNPHILTSPINAKMVAENIAVGLGRTDPANRQVYMENLQRFQRRIDQALYGEELLDLLGVELLDTLAAKGQLQDFLEGQSLDGAGLLEKLGGWLHKALPFRDQKIICYHKNWIYFATLFKINIVDYIEPKVGIPPSARHVGEILDLISRENIKVLWTANYFAESKPKLIAEKTGIQAVIVPTDVHGIPQVADYFQLIDYWINQLAARYPKQQSSGEID